MTRVELLPAQMDEVNGRLRARLADCQVMYHAWR